MMAVTVTLVFSDERHREAWLIAQKVISERIPSKDAAGDYAIDQVAPERGPRRASAIRRIDYEQRKGNTDLQYTVGPLSFTS